VKMAKKKARKSWRLSRAAGDCFQQVASFSAFSGWRLDSGYLLQEFRGLGDRDLVEAGEVGGVSDEYDDVLWRRLLPTALVIEVGVGAGGADDVEVRGFFLVGALENSLEGRGKGAAALVGEAGGMDVAVNGRVVRDVIVAGKLFRAAPAEEVLLDVAAFGMAAHPALEPVVSKVRRSVWSGRGIWGALAPALGFRRTASLDHGTCLRG
jgi:hypothetical protein